MSQVRFVLPFVAFFGCDLDKEEEGEFELELGGGGGLLFFERLGAGHKMAYFHYFPGHHFGFGLRRMDRFSCGHFFLSGSLRFCWGRVFLLNLLMH